MENNLGKNLSYLFALLPAIFLQTIPTDAEDFNARFRHLSAKDGLAQNTVRAIVQDKFGYMWFATKAGLCKYDGYSFTSFKTDVFDSSSLSDPLITCMCIDKDDIFWIGTENGFNRFDYVHGIFTRYMHNPNDTNSISNNMITSVCTDSAQNIWIGTVNGLNKIGNDRITISRIFHSPGNGNGITSNEISCILCDRSGILWIGTKDQGLNSYNVKTDQYKQYVHDPDNKNSLSDNSITCLFEDANRVLWIGTEQGGLNKFDRQRRVFTAYSNKKDDPYSLTNNHVKVICEDKSGTMWIGTERAGLSRFNRSSELFFNYRPDLNNPYGLHAASEIFSLFDDSFSNLWIGSRGYGLNILIPRSDKFSNYSKELCSGLSDNMIWKINGDQKGNIWIATHFGGLNKWNRERNIFTHYLHDPNDSFSIADNLVTIVYIDKSGQTWAGTNSGLDKFISNKNQFYHYKHDPEDPRSLSNNQIRAIYEDKQGNLWIGTRGGGLNKFDSNEEKFYRFLPDPNDTSSITSNNVYYIFEDSKNRLWIGTMGGGLNKLDRESGTFLHYKSDVNNRQSLSNNNVIFIHEDVNNTLWIATYGGGLNKFDPEQETFIHYTEREGLPSNEVYNILEDNRNNLWLSTNRGLCQFNTQNGTLKIYYQRDGLQSDEYNMFAAYKNQNGEMFFGGPQGFSVFHPDSINDNPFPPLVVIDGIKISNKPVPVGPLPDGRILLEKPLFCTNAITLSYQDKVISLEFNALHYSAPDKNQYAYILEGIDENWNYVGTQRFVTYNALPPGKYTFHVKASNSDGLWNEEGASLTIKVTPPFWQTGWFYALCLFIAMATIAVAYRRLIVRLERQKEEQQLRKITADFNHVLEESAAAVYRRNYKQNTYEYMGEGIKEITGYSAHEIMVDTWEKMILTTEGSEKYTHRPFEEIIDEVQNNGITRWQTDFQILTKSGEKRWVRDLASALVDKNGRCYGCLGILFDISDRKSAEIKLSNTTEKLKKITRELVTQNKEMETDLNMARKIQTALLTDNQYSFPEKHNGSKRVFNFNHRYIPASTLGGDFFEIFPVSDNKVGTLICDVMGHGTRASLLTFYLRGLIQELMPFADDPGLFMNKMNHSFRSITERFDSVTFATMVYYVADISTNNLRYAIAGHPNPLLLRRSRGTIEYMLPDGENINIALGIRDSIPYPTHEINLTHDDIVFLYTDGLYEFVDKNDAIFGRKRLDNLIRNEIRHSPSQIMQNVLTHIESHAKDEFYDDVCMVTMHVVER